jgi:hypothetical protein
MSNKKKAAEGYIHEKSNSIPMWVKQLDDFKAKIRHDLHSTTSEAESGIKYLHPIDVPGSAKR